MFNFFETLLNAISSQGSGAQGKDSVESPATTRYAAAVIIARLLGDKEITGVQD